MHLPIRYRLPALLAGNSVVLKQESDYYEHFYKAMKPWVHYVPLDRTLSDLEDKLEWLKSHDEEVFHFLCDFHSTF